MKGQIIELGGGSWKSILLTEKELWLSKNAIKDYQKFERAIRYPGTFDVSGQSYSLERIEEIKFNEASNLIVIGYSTKSKLSKINIKFITKEQANEFGHTLGQELKFRKSMLEEKKLKPLLENTAYLLISIIVTVFLGTQVDSGDLDSDGGTRKSRKGGSILRVLYDIIGQTGIIIIGSFISIFLVYRLYKRYNSPANEIMYKK